MRDVGRHMSAPSCVEGVEKVIAAFGEWPSFHDSEVLSIVLKRDAARAGEPPVLHLQLHVRRHREHGAGTAAYHLALTHDYLIEISFHDVSELELGGFNGQNVIDGIVIAPDREPSGVISVEVEPIFGVGGAWQCKSVKIESVEVVRNAV
jgi:hypothetical protein